MKLELGQMLDYTKPTNVQVQIRSDGKVLWVNIDGSAILRCSAIECLEVNDERVARHPIAETEREEAS